MTCRIDIVKTENGFLIKYWSKFVVFRKPRKYVAESTSSLQKVINKILQEKFPSEVYDKE